MNADSIETLRSSLRIFVTGASGFIGGSVASTLKADGNMVRGLVRSREKVDAVAARGVETVVGTLDDLDLLQAEARAADAVVNAASSDHRGAVEALIAGLSGSGKPLIHSSGSSVVADLAMGEPSDRIFDEATPIVPHAERAARVAIDQLVLTAPGIRSVVLCNSMISGPQTDRERVSIARKVLGDDTGIIVDANGNYTCDEALESMRCIADYSIEWYEEPLPPLDFEGYATLRARAPIPIAC